MESKALTSGKVAVAAASGSPRPRRLHPRLLLDVRSSTLAGAAVRCALPLRRGRVARALLAGRPEAVVCYSVRSGFDLLLEALALPPRSEVIFSALTHPDMPRIAEAHGLEPVPVDLDLETLAPREDLLRRTVSERTRLVVVAHLFGGRVDLAPVARVARTVGALVVEDCAQSLDSGHPSRDPDAAVSLFSFGTIKTATALGGALLLVADPRLRRRVRELETAWPTQSRVAYLWKVTRILALTVVGRPRPYALLARMTRDLDGLVNGSVRAFPGDDLLRKVRHRPATPLLWMLVHRLDCFDTARLRERARAGEEVAAGLPPTLFHPGGAALSRTHWVFPVLTADPTGLVAALRRAGFDASTATSAIRPVAAPADRPELDPVAARQLVASVVFLPVYPELPEEERGRLLEVLR